MEAKNLGDMLRRSCRTYAGKPAMLVPTGSEFKPITYAELWDCTLSCAAALQNLGLKRGDRVALQSENCAEWSVLDWACRVLGIVLVPIYPTLPTDQTQYIVKDSGASLVVSSTPEQAAKVAGLGIKTILLKEGSESLTKLAESLGALDEGVANAEIDQTQLGDLTTIIYTSGTTGPPKGAMLDHRAIAFICEQAKFSVPFNSEDLFLSFLPMSHVFERVAGQALPISCGATVAYSKSLLTLGSDMLAVKPTVLLCVPRFLEATMDKILDGVKKQPPLRQKLFHWALGQGKAKLHGGFAPFAGLLDKLVGAKIREKTGGRIRYMVSGGAALPPHVADFYLAFGLNVLQGYGLTETTAATCVNHPDKNKPHTVGPPIEGVEVKIAADGEILVRGPSRMMGYFNLPEATAEAIDAEGWFHTGDIGEWEGKNLKITDRKKDILVLANGKNIAPQPIENKLKESPLIAEVVLFGDGNEYVYGLVIPNFDRLREELGSTAEDAALAASPEAKARIKTEIDQVNRTLADFEKVKRHALLAATFTIESGELTPSMKVRRKVVREKYADALKDLQRA